MFNQIRNKKLYLCFSEMGCLSRSGSIKNSEFSFTTIETNLVLEILLSLKIQDYGRFSNNENLFP